MLNARAVQMMTFLVEMVIYHRNHLMIDKGTMVANGTMRNVVVIVDLKRCVRNRISIIVNNQADEEEVVVVVAAAEAAAVAEQVVVALEILPVNSVVNVMW